MALLMAVPWTAQAQFCTPNPTSKDGSGITNVSFGMGTEVVNSAVTWASSPYYINNSSQIGAVPASLDAEINITFATGYTYSYIIWVDWNGDSVFNGTEVVAVGSAPQHQSGNHHGDVQHCQFAGHRHLPDAYLRCRLLL